MDLHDQLVDNRLSVRHRVHDTMTIGCGRVVIALNAIRTMRGEALPVTSLLTACQRFELRDGTLGLDVAGKVRGGRESPAERRKRNV